MNEISVIDRLEKFKDILPDIDKLYSLNKLSYIANGKYGVIFKYDDKVLKITENYFENEFSIHQELDKLSLTPKIFDYHIINNVSLTLMEFIDGFLNTYLTN